MPKNLSNEFTVIEFENDADFSDLSHIPIAYTTDEILEFPINVFVDLEKMKLVKRYNNNSEFDSGVYFGASKDKMYMILGNLEFDELVSVPDYVREEIGKDDALDMTMIDRCHYNFFSRVFPENKFINVLVNSKMHNIWCESLAILPLTCFLAVWYNMGVENIWEV